MNQEYKMNGSEKFMGVLLILVMALIPLICKVAVIPVSGDEYNVVRSSSSVTDVFSYYKSVFIIIFGVVIALAMAFQILGQDGFTGYSCWCNGSFNIVVFTFFSSQNSCF